MAGGFAPPDPREVFGKSASMTVLRVVPDLPAISVEVDDLEAVTARAGNAVVHGPVTEPWGVRRIFLRDPEGNLVNVLCHDRQGRG